MSGKETHLHMSKQPDTMKMAALLDRISHGLKQSLCFLRCFGNDHICIILTLLPAPCRGNVSKHLATPPGPSVYGILC